MRRIILVLQLWTIPLEVTFPCSLSLSSSRPIELPP
ncbi:hypothetical protein A2U01_0102826, partial [Trifolium medium]|nr:hypothetical protein [Trifolium medium]